MEAGGVSEPGAVADGSLGTATATAAAASMDMAAPTLAAVCDELVARVDELTSMMDALYARMDGALTQPMTEAELQEQCSRIEQTCTVLLSDLRLHKLDNFPLKLELPEGGIPALLKDLGTEMEKIQKKVTAMSKAARA